MKYLIILVLALSANTFAQTQKTDIAEYDLKKWYTNSAVCSGYILQLSKSTKSIPTLRESLQWFSISKSLYVVAIDTNVITNNDPNPKEYRDAAIHKAKQSSFDDIAKVVDACMVFSKEMKRSVKSIKKNRATNNTTK